MQDRPILVIGATGKTGRRVASRFEARGIDSEAIARVVCPVGLDIGAISPVEIAVSITAQLVSLRRGGPR